MRFDYPVLTLINTNVINGHQKAVDSIRLILDRIALCYSVEAFGPHRGLVGQCGQEICPLLTTSPPLTPGFPLSSLHPPLETLPP